MTSVSRSPVFELSDCDRFHKDGFLIIPKVLSPEQCEALSSQLTCLFEQQQRTSPRTMGGLRNVLRLCPQARDVAWSPELISLVDGLVGRKAFPVRGIFFDKQPEANWSVPWHQDLAITVAKRIDTPGFGPWSVKDGVVRAQPPQHILGDMITVRLHLDECYADNGALRIVPRSHQQGELSAEDIVAWTNRQETVVCEVPRGGALLLRPLLLHASSSAKAPSHRRVLHIEYASEQLPNGLKWFEQS